jgi:hypothetical protein
MKKPAQQLITVEQLSRGEFIYDRMLTTNFKQFWAILETFDVKPYYLEKGLGNGNRYFKASDIEVATKVASII